MRLIKISTNKYYLDTYAYIELSRKNEKYLPYIDAEFVLTQPTLAEMYYIFLRDKGENEALERFSTLLLNTIPLSNSAILRAMNIRLQHKKKHLSYADCLGYATAVELHIPFLTGDKAFQDLPNVEFIA